MESKQSKAKKLFRLLAAAGPSGILNTDLATNPDVGWTFNALVHILRKQGHIIQRQRIGSRGRIYRIVLAKSAPAPEPLPIFKAIMDAQEGKRG